ncbi:acetyl-CoA carboxylase, carboxyltransferase subunit beta [Clostridium botulinum]|uniref:Acetyl-coenzyme A carboxylase carboxyl transferase subunit beta n=2 Tax=Clostridium botulinum TaxID=1491 RepID=ACCD_CLOBM|nr:acetyl-CoA carboxylase, carboxyltransferase subunit beta [Clostridium botulinum]B1KU65.1 RecName: Full=Acetyl-coenzyme A carboxylase carboxyl transferase subunit beta; Short=ACCase subunit beta; Short=Acetyl-CoA carboxylase carboxyltransferase subunit beta [Clostridium botulinum A3 str. Loch Maree]ACA55450.1 acetyl-CoA carboxylase, carboxyl transferase, beta subunit [Clostridium botulinum A3 str. Loch Maree]NFH66244.1 acetyl-CoA carboxylase carboxyltransferase subunit beta [Clostridium botuli
MLKNLFRKTKYITVSQKNIENYKRENTPTIPDGMWVKCNKCGEILYQNDLEKNYMACNLCGNHFRIGAKERIKYLFDKDTFKEWDYKVKTENPLSFKGYDEKIENIKEETNLSEAVTTGKGKIADMEVVVCIMDSKFMMGSMGSVVGEKITRAIERAIELRLPVIIFTVSGGARMQEGILSLMQMAKVSSALAKLDEEGLLYICVLTDPTTGGVTASFAMLGDIILAEPDALIGFAGKRVIEQTINEKLPEDFQKSEFLLEHGFIDKIVPRSDLRKVLAKLINMHKNSF